ncbi:NEL-type E3 ubiquitin ligase domain-containing protein [Noviherbaspirillum galbum]|uniref:NEL domain-containing protein n=1 Tax=Noviherbaspirillum galbum TaxID=2709383 RepID=A0A6B3SVH6_9BURK|nr:NEL-type E3 ubiquitin ligase domain-containing protein [Noviherbaspirillum galbum]NEX64501.1 hypothetical protein [Noviherbaspirillum galbum]
MTWLGKLIPFNPCCGTNLSHVHEGDARPEAAMPGWRHHPDPQSGFADQVNRWETAGPRDARQHPVRAPAARMLRACRRDRATGLTIPAGHADELPMRLVCRLTHLEELRVSGLSLAVPPEIDRLANLHTLSLRRAGLREVPPQLFSLRRLRQLDLSGNAIRLMPRELGQLASLEELDLSGNPIAALPRETGWLDNLGQLNVANTALSALPQEINWLPRLRSIDARGSDITRLPAQVDRLSRLRKLSLASENLTAVPPPVAALTGLRSLSLESAIAAVPAWLYALPSLDTLVLAGRFAAMPDGIQALSRLRHLEIRAPIARLPGGVPRLGELECLVVRNGMLETVPPELGSLSSLGRIVLTGNRLSSLPAELAGLPRLRLLDIRDNPIRVVPREILEHGALAHDDGLSAAVQFHGMRPHDSSLARALLPPARRTAFAMGQDGRPIESADCFYEWLDRVASLSVMREPGAANGALSMRLADLVQSLAAGPPSLRATCFELARDASSSCDDNVTDCINDMSVLVFNERFNPAGKTPAEMMKLARCHLALQEVDAAAVRWLASHPRHHDPLEVKMAFRTRLRAAFDLPLPAREMQFERYANVGDQDLRRAEVLVRQRLADADALRSYLATWAPFQRYVEMRCQPEADRLTRHYQQRAQQFEEDSANNATSARYREKYDNIMGQWERALSTLIGRTRKDLLAELDRQQAFSTLQTMASSSRPRDAAVSGPAPFSAVSERPRLPSAFRIGSSGPGPAGARGARLHRPPPIHLEDWPAPAIVYVEDRTPGRPLASTLPSFLNQAHRLAGSHFRVVDDMDMPAREPGPAITRNAQDPGALPSS